MDSAGAVHRPQILREAEATGLRSALSPFLSSQFMPAGGMAVLGVSGALYHGLKYREWKRW